jgi:hypothetical protein
MVQMSDECDNTGWWDCITGDEPWKVNVNGDRFWEWEERAVNNAKNWVN